MSTTDVNAALDRFMSRFLDACRQADSWPETQYDPQWPSDCYQNSDARAGDWIGWRPVLQSQPNDMFDRLAHALEATLHPDIIAFYTRYWSDPITAETEQGQLSLLQVWNPADMERLRGNLIGHAMDKQRRRLPLTLFLAVALPNDELIISLDNHDGSIWLEAPGKAPHYKLAEGLAEFIDRLTPLAP